MSGAAAVLGHVAAAGFVLIGAVAVATWVRRRGRMRACLAIALGFLALVVVLGQINDLIQMPKLVSLLSVIFFMGSGYALVELRHTLLPVSWRVRLALLAVLIATTSLAVPFALHPTLKPSLFVLIVVCALIFEWALCIVEPALQFRLAARRLPVVQRKRLRALSTGYLGIVAALVFALGTALASAATKATTDAATALVLSVVATAAMPLFYIGFAPPRWLRRQWRHAETDAYRKANSELLAFNDEPAAMADRAVEWAMRFVGARAGFLLSAEGTVLAWRGDLPHSEMQSLARQAMDGTSSGPRLLGNIALVPMSTGGGGDTLVVVAGAFSPLFGLDELRTLDEFAVSVAVAMDRVRLSHELRTQTERTQSLLEAMSELGAGLLVAEAGRLVYVNDAFASMTGYSASELEGTSFRDYALPEDRPVIEAHMRGPASEHAMPWKGGARLVRKDGTVIDIETVVHVLSGARPRRRIALVQDISARKIAERKLADAARLDPLTGVANRRTWDDVVATRLAAAASSGEPLSVALLDLDGFKEFNDDWGHQRGDRLLIDVAQGWRGALREEDLLARYGGDEFAVLMPHCASDEAAAVVQRLTEFRPERASAGVAQWDGHETSDELVARADAALLRSKRDRIGSVTMASMRAGDRSSGWMDTLEQVLQRRLIRAAYQPIVCFDTGEVIGYEALMRPTTATADASVDELFAAAQKLGYSRDLDWVSRRAALEGAADLPDGSLLFVNVSARALLDPVHDSDQMLMLLKWTGRSPDDVVLEISEREVIRNLSRLRDVLAEYRRHGFRFALDDVGEGHSTLEVLEAANAEYIKVARRLTEHADEPTAAAAVLAVVTFALSSGAILIAEGVSHLQMVESMREFGVRYGQGFALGRPAFLAHAIGRAQERETAV